MLCALLACLWTARGGAQVNSSSPFSAQVGQLIAEPRSRYPNEQSASALKRLYELAEYNSLWTMKGRSTRQAREVLQFVQAVESRGLRPHDYALAALTAVMDSVDRSADQTPLDSSLLARMDVLTSQSLLRLLRDLSRGRVDPQSLGLELPQRAEPDLTSIVIGASRASEAPDVIAAVEPRYAGYAALRRLLERYRRLAADTSIGWAAPARTVRPNDIYDGAPRLRRLLVALGDLVPNAVFTTEPDRYAGALVLAVMHFQRRHGLQVDGVLGRSTGAELAVPLGERVAQIELALERWRWLPDHAPDRYIVVNIPAFRLYAFENDSIAAHPVLSMNVVVGDAEGRHDTPVFVGEMRELVFRPYWDVPPSIARKELVPAIRRGTIDMESDGYEIVSLGEEPQVRRATSANLAKVAAGELRLRQRPGPGNALGLVKFLFPNSHNVYVHGTPVMQVFTFARRDYSHGCIRAEQPDALASFALAGDSSWTEERITAAMHGRASTRAPIARPIAVFILYMTAIVGPDGTAYFYPDLYDQDILLARAFDQR